MIEMNLLGEIDRTDMQSMVDAFPEMLQITTLTQEFRQSIQLAKKDNIEGICLLGMGGSAISGLLTKGVIHSDVPIISVRNYSIPKFVKQSWIIIAVSYSGNTEETLLSLREAKKKGSTCFAITSGGKMRTEVPSNRTHVLPKGFQPRAALPLIFSAVFPTIELLLGKEHIDLKLIAAQLKKTQKQWGTEIRKPEDFAQFLVGKIPIFTGWSHLFPVAYRAKCQINENAKAAAFYSELPEVNHNEIESVLTFTEKKLVPIFLRSVHETRRISQRFDITHDIYKDYGCEPVSIKLRSQSKLEETLAITHYLDRVSVNLANIIGVDPINVDRIQILKKRLASDNETI
ncbi:MAG: bifunctional phosphoglucose/phosphomannose isomerase [Candidatus Lokiarchaeota archaeon]|nr:bifunctional phosphoglucose/phosphomannose isomerase [Candidatus Lokiarchaeota archaeon]